MLTVDGRPAAKPVKAADGADQLQFNAPLWHNWWIGMMWCAAHQSSNICPAEQSTRVEPGNPGLHYKHAVRINRE